MPQASQDSVFEALLVSTLQRVIDFLKYAEAKNGALLTFNSAWALALVGVLGSERLLPAVIRGSVSLALPFFVASGICAMASFWPRTNLPWFLGGRRAGPHERNLLFFGDIATLTPNEAEREFRDRYYPTKGAERRQEYLRDLVIQINVNSQIAKRKLRLFQAGMWLVGAAAIFLLLALAFWSVGGNSGIARIQK
jgi:Family of unknown function (DUF5706)